MRLETQKQTLIARDESIKKLLEMLQNKGMGKFNEEITGFFFLNQLLLENLILKMFFFHPSSRQRRRTCNVPANASNGSETGKYQTPNY